MTSEQYSSFLESVVAPHRNPPGTGPVDSASIIRNNKTEDDFADAAVDKFAKENPGASSADKEKVRSDAKKIYQNAARRENTLNKAKFEVSVTGSNLYTKLKNIPFKNWMYGIDTSKPPKVDVGSSSSSSSTPGGDGSSEPSGGGSTTDPEESDPYEGEPTADPEVDSDYDVEDEFNDEDFDENYRDYPNEAFAANPITTTETPSGESKSSFPDLGNAKAFAAVKDTNTTFSAWHMAYGVAIGGFRNYEDYQIALMAHLSRLVGTEDADRSGQPISSNIDSAQKYMEEALTSAQTDEENVNGEQISGLRTMYRSPSVSDATIGGNDAINPYAAFNMDDDIIHDVSFSKGKEYSWGMGRCYAEMYESKQQVVYLTMGLPKYRNLQVWLQNATNNAMSMMNDYGDQKGFSLGNLLIKGVKLAIALPWLPIQCAINIVNGIKDYKVTEYFYFRDTMALFYRYCNSFLSEVAVGMGLYANGDLGGPNNAQTGNGGANMSSTQAAKMNMDMPEILRDGPDIFKIMCKRAQRANTGNIRYDMTDDMITSLESHYVEMGDKFDRDPKQWEKASGFRNFWSGIMSGALEGMNFIGFRIEKSSNSSESFSNSTQESPLLQTLNAKVAELRQQRLDALGQGQGTLAGLLNFTRNTNQAISNIKDAASNLGSLLSGKGGDVGKTIAFAASGNGFFDLPKQWSGSSGMSRSISLNFKLRSKTGGDNVSIFQSIMVPLSILISAALPRAVGDSTYTSPFLVRAFCKGMFSIPAGIINTLSITRGSSEFGWSLNRIPTVIDVNVSIDDLSPMLFLSIAGGAGGLDALKQAFSNNSKMHEYINTLVGIGLKERYYLLGQLKRRLKTAALISKNTLFSATYQGYVMGDSAIVRSLMAITPWTWAPRN